MSIRAILKNLVINSVGDGVHSAITEMRELVSGRSLVIELSKCINWYLKKNMLVSKVCEDNVGTQNLANRKSPHSFVDQAY